MAKGPKPRPAIERFWTKVQKTEGCWLWTGGTDEGYGALSTTLEPDCGRRERAHRFAYKRLVGPIPDGLYVCHTCDNRRCVNPDHLFLGSHLANIEDKLQKERHCRGSSHGMSKLSEDDVIEIRRLYSTGDFLQREIAEKYGVCKQTISAIVRGQTWRHLKEGND